MTFKDLREKIRQTGGVTIKFTDVDLFGENAGPENGMMAKIIFIREYKTGLFFAFDFSEFVDYDKKIGTANWYDLSGNPCLTWFETGHYPKDGIWWNAYLPHSSLKSKLIGFEVMGDCNFCEGDEAVFWQDGDNNAFIDNQGAMLITVQGHELQFSVDYCPKCGKKFLGSHKREGGASK